MEECFGDEAKREAGAAIKCSAYCGGAKVFTKYPISNLKDTVMLNLFQHLIIQFVNQGIIRS
jgi:hypothetical protein